MKLFYLSAQVLPLIGLVLGAPGPDPEAAASKRINKLQDQYRKHIHDTIKPRKTGCTKKNILERKEWGSLSKKDRLSYISAVHCLANLTALTPPTAIPGARTRYDDFVGSHILQTLFVHASGLFLPYHRYYVHLYETALRSECNYRGAQPYWDWTLSYTNPHLSTVFDGSPYSLGSNGEYIPNREPIEVPIPNGPTLVFPPATGGGCIASGPFTPDKFQIHLGPVGYEPQGPQGGLGYNPRCLTRDLSPAFSLDTRPTNVTKLLDGCADLGCFNLQLDTPGGVHGSGHFLMGTTALDVFASPSDPVFWLHHAQVDRLWAIWQAQDAGRINEVWGTGTAGDFPPSPNVTLDTPINFGVISPPIKIRDAVSTIDGDLCYIYA
ncbi:Grixazone synthase [Podospora aff. communis PSN243]|uniref:Grixazone synthase n=1 Tax=Podospora aff. communis PSN243 TaxID=3040156 RepID=A0AAV9GLX0_9PEZI|nr:Grixazone synthase [Podospora aff. communis PSN243]